MKRSTVQAGRSHRAIACLTVGGLGLLIGLLGLAAGVTAPALLRLEVPRRHQPVGLEGLELLVRFDAAGRAEPSTLRVLLNEADVTGQLVVATNGAHGRLHGLLDGENRLRVEVFGRGFWPPGLLVEETLERRIRFERPVDLDRG